MKIPQQVKALYGIEFAVAWATWLTGTILPLLIAEYNLDLAQAGLISMVQNLAALPIVLSAGLLSERASPERVLIVGAFVMALVPIGLLPVKTFIPLLIVLALFGAGSAIIDPLTNSILGKAPAKERGKLFSLLHAFFGFGGTITPLIAALIIKWGAGWRGVAVAGAGLALITAVWYWRAHQGASPWPLEASAASTRPEGNGSLWRKPGLWILALALFLFTGAYRGIGTWVVTFFEYRYATTHAVAAIGLSLLYATITAGRFLTYKTGHLMQRHTLLLVSAILGTVALAVLPAGGPWLARAAVIFFGLTTGGIYPMAFALASEEFPGRLAIVTGFMIACARFGGMLVPWLMGVFGKYYGLTGAMFLNAGVAFLAVLAFIWFAAYMRRRNRDAASGKRHASIEDEAIADEPV